MAKYEAGQSGNLIGRPKGVSDKRTQYRELIQSHAKELVDKVIEKALEGDIAAMKLCLERKQHQLFDQIG